MAAQEQAAPEREDAPPGWPSPEERPDLPPPAKGGWEILGGLPRTRKGVLFTKWIDRLLRIKPKPW